MFDSQCQSLLQNDTVLNCLSFVRDYVLTHFSGIKPLQGFLSRILNDNNRNTLGGRHCGAVVKSARSSVGGGFVHVPRLPPTV